MTSLLLGAHVDQADPVAEAVARDAGLAQFFLGDPQGWKAPTLAYPGGAGALRVAADVAGVVLYVHAPYVVNVATTNNRIRVPSRTLLQQHVDLAAEVGAAGLVVHGGHVLAGGDPADGVRNWRTTVERLDARVPILIENTAGGARAMARHIDMLARLWDAVSEVDPGGRVGFCLDTCHAHAGGEELRDVVDRVKAVTGRVDLVHANDSKDGFDSGRDRHESLGRGRIAAEDLLAVVAAAGAPVVCETPGGAEGQAADIAWLRERLPG